MLEFSDAPYRITHLTTPRETITARMLKLGADSGHTFPPGASDDPLGAVLGLGRHILGGYLEKHGLNGTIPTDDPSLFTVLETFASTDTSRPTSPSARPSTATTRRSNASPRISTRASDRTDHCYFGHTHRPFTGHKHDGVCFHNIGSGIRGMGFQPLPFGGGELCRRIAALPFPPAACPPYPFPMLDTDQLIELEITNKQTPYAIDV